MSVIGERTSKTEVQFWTLKNQAHLDLEINAIQDLVACTHQSKNNTTTTGNRLSKTSLHMRTVLCKFKPRIWRLRAL